MNRTIPRLSPVFLRMVRVAAAGGALSWIVGCGGLVAQTDDPTGVGGSSAGSPSAGGSQGGDTSFGGAAGSVSPPGGHAGAGAGGSGPTPGGGAGGTGPTPGGGAGGTGPTPGGGAGGTGPTPGGGAGGTGPTPAGGTGGSGGASGFAGGPPVTGCVVEDGTTCGCPAGQTGISRCSADGGPVECVCPGTTEFELLKWYQAAIVGNWAGEANTPWTPTYGVRFRFDSDGRYSAFSDDGSVPALYYGTDDDDPRKTFDLDDIKANGASAGSIVILFPSGNAVTDTIKTLTITPDGATLKMTVYHNVQFGPISYNLKRVAAP
jgi:hypothetical protein